MSKRNTQKKGCGGFLFIIVGLLVLVLGAWKVWEQWGPAPQYKANEMGSVDQPLTWNGQWSGYGSKGKGDQLLVPIEAVKKGITTRVFEEGDSRRIILTSKMNVAVLEVGESKGKWNGQDIDWGVEPERVDGQVFIPMTALERLYGVQAVQYESTGGVQVRFPGQTIQLGVINEQQSTADTVTLYEQADKRSPEVSQLASGTPITMWKEQAGWFLIEDNGGRLGYIASDSIEQKGSETVEKQPVPPKPKFVEEGHSVSLAWEAVYSRNPDTDTLPKMPGVNVISPTWFSLADEQGNVKSKADSKLLDWAHRNGKQVWALFSNSFDPDLTTKALSTYERRETTINQLLDYAKQYRIDGINIDYENVNVEDRDVLTQFVREMTPRLHSAGLVVSIDVTAKSGSSRWSKFLDRGPLAESVDFMMVMAYDEHWATSPKAGSVASLPWTETAVTRIMKEDGVPANKLVLGMPLYTRIWTETEKDGERKVSSKAVGMRTIQELLSKQQLKPTFAEQEGQNYVEYKENGTLQRIWIEDERSIKARIDLAKRLDLAGVAAWARSLGNAEIWDIIHY
ncbi:glycosyl hydrolase family 18 protein [Paenibacillus sp. 481]|uniref:glycosyl hydrolase family 18 protein n=1 Tax=Paenibacillus sp. 481 TaxID=2835869 RepID=UPI001E5205A5|nr:glycosyl hydrolase family 18 protein [Paenibacillus sp. 481]